MKKTARFIFLCCVLVVLVSSQWLPETLLKLSNQRRSGARSQWFFRHVRSMIETEMNRNILRSRNKLQPVISETWPFPCEVNGTRSMTKPKSVHKLRPGDIDVIAAIGDSLSAGTGLTATNVLEIYVANRGLAPSGGGQGTWREYLTLPNILKEFNANLTGYAKEPAASTSEKAKFNIARLGAMSRDMLKMAYKLVDRIRSSPEVNFFEDWKMVTMMAGPNDFCMLICLKEDLDEALREHREDMLDVLRYLRDHLPRTIVNLVPAPNLKSLIEFKNKPPFCRLNHNLVCPCLASRRHVGRRDEFIRFMSRWQQVELELAYLPELDTDTFTVVFQPFSLEFFIPDTVDGSTDYSYLSEDCFHFSQKMNAIVSNSLWNNLLEPVGQKSTRQSKFLVEFQCPTKESPYIFTRQNSQNIRRT